MVCKLKRHVITNDGDFIPAGTPVDVMGWGNGGEGDNPPISCRAHHYMFVGYDEDRNPYQSHVSYGLFIDVDPDNLEWVNLPRMADEAEEMKGWWKAAELSEAADS